MLGVQPVRDGRELGPGAVDADTRSHSRDDGETARAPVRLNRGRRDERTRRRRHVDVVLRRILRYLREYTDHRVNPVVHLERLADDGRVAAERRAPESVAQDEDRRCACLVFPRTERAPEDRLHAEDVEEVRRDHTRLHPSRLVLAEQDERHRVVVGDSCEARCLRPVVDDLGVREPRVRDFGQCQRLSEIEQLLAPLVRQRSKEHAVDDAEDRRVRANAQSERDDRGDGESRTLAKRANREPQILTDAAHGFPPVAFTVARRPYVATLGLDLPHIAERCLRRFARRGRCHARRDELLRPHLQVKPDLVAHIARLIVLKEGEPEGALHRRVRWRAR
jgi:hypothetical protein